MQVKLEFEIDDPRVLHSIGRQAGVPGDRINPAQVGEFLQRKLLELLRDISTRRDFRKMSTKEIERRVYHLCRVGSIKGTIPLYGATDRELVDLSGLPHNKVRWARYNLQKKGFLTASGKRSDDHATVFSVTPKELPPELHEIPGEFEPEPESAPVERQLNDESPIFVDAVGSGPEEGRITPRYDQDR
jgi:hypothetical protein